MVALIQLRDGPLITEAALALALALEAEGHRMSALDGKLLVSDGSTLNAAQTAAIRANRLHLLAIAAYQPPEAR